MKSPSKFQLNSSLSAQELNYRLIHGKLEVVERAGHEVNVDAPEALAKILRRFWG